MTTQARPTVVDLFASISRKTFGHRRLGRLLDQADRKMPTSGSGENPPLGRLLRDRLQAMDGSGNRVMVVFVMWHSLFSTENCGR